MKLRFSPTAWAKLLFLRDRGDSEIAAFGVSAEDDPLFVEDLAVVAQTADFAGVAFEDEAVAEFFEEMVDAGLRPERFARIWVHTHPGDSPTPSFTDEQTFGRVFGGCQWAVMLVLARKGRTHARLRFNVGPGGEADLPVAVDFSRPFAAADFEGWETEYRERVKAVGGRLGSVRVPASLWDDFELCPWDEASAAVMDMDPDERRELLRQLALAEDEETMEDMLDACAGEV